MKQNDFFGLYARGESFKWASQGIRDFFRSEPNAWIHLVATVVVIDLSFILDISNIEWLAIVIVTGAVWTAELFNTAIEKMMDHLSPEISKPVKFIKDVAAGAVLVTALTALIVGCIIFIPKI